MHMRPALSPCTGTPVRLRLGTRVRRTPGQRGLALVMVLWMVAALLVTVTGVVYAVRGQVQTVAAHRELAAAGALGDAGAVLAARELAARAARAVDNSGLRRYEVTFEQATIAMKVVPLTGFVDLNTASEALLTELIAVGADVERNRASSLAQRIIDFRDADENPQPAGAEDPAYAAAGSPFRTRGGPLEATEDLLQVLGFDFDLFERLRPLVTVHGRGDGRVDPVAAPLSVLRVLAGGNEQMASAYAAARDAAGVLADTTRFPTAFIAARQPSSRYLLQASVPLSNGAFAVARRIVEAGATQEGLPWQTLWAERSVEAELKD
jgi:general secretion pathway protein K